MKTLIHAPPLRLFLLLSPCSILFGAEAPSSAPTSAASPKDDPIVLTPFAVSTGKDVGYLANDTLAGSRLRTNLADVPNAISVFTPELIADLNAFGEADLMRYSASAVPERTDQTSGAQGIAIETGGFQFRVRGQQASRARNYFGTAIIPDTFNAERFEEARGPNAILFGLGGAGGILNTSTKTARPGRTFTTLALTADNNDLLRFHVDHNHRLTPRLAIRLNGLTSRAGGWQEHMESRHERLAFAATWRPLDKLTLRLDTEWGHGRNTLSRFYAPFDNVSLWRLSGSPLVASGTAAADTARGIGRRGALTRVTFVGNDGSWRNFSQTVFSQPIATRNNSVILPGDWAAFDRVNPYPESASFAGPGGTSEFKQKSLGVFAEVEPLKNLFIELAALNELRDHDVYDTTHDVFRVLGEPGQTFRDGAANPWAGLYYTESRWVLRRARDSGERLRLTASYTLDLGKWGRHSLAGLASRENTGNPRHVGFLVLDGSPFNPQPQNTVNQVWTRRYITNPADLSQFAAPDFRTLPRTLSVTLDPGAAPRTFSTTWAYNELHDQWGHTDGRLASLQSYFLRDRLVTTVGWRSTKLTSYVRPTNNPNTQVAARPESFGPLRFLGEAPPAAPYDFERLSWGAVAKPLPWLSLYANYSENAQPPGTTVTLIPNSSPLPLNAGQGRDYGAMLTLFGGRVFVRVGRFTTDSVDQASAFGANNVSERNNRIMDAMLAAGAIAPASVVRFTGDGFDLADLSTKGHELNVTANLTPSWRLMVSGSRSTSVQTNMLKRSRPAAAQVLPLWRTPAAQGLVTVAGVTVAQEILDYQSWLAATTAVENQGMIGHRELELRGFTRYEIREGRARGLFFGGGLSYGSAPAIGRSTAGELFRAKVRREADALVGYRTRLPRWLGAVQAELQLNAKNLLQSSPYTLVRRDPDGQLFRAALNPPTTYVLSARMNF
jgi:outer membrane receptor protein involved in Fe transport